ncbi:uncharacterized protein LOC111326548 [Stylophora pistillata]|uniref:uncharacterized protein LOC111326548 n=1 Tax=Stylophora pistillata TaxID=50429 RepID=UPI000C04AC0F|nr:uncharacterized protein LOC111326548 [Stylophora pistillata]
MHYKNHAVTPNKPDVCLNLRFEQFKVPPEERNMGFSFVFTTYIILLACIIQIQASLLPLSGVHVRRETQKFQLTITERGTRFYEKVEINEDEQIAYFNVPAHNGLSLNEELFDFRMVR